jgi:hypothetical protein
VVLQIGMNHAAWRVYSVCAPWRLSECATCAIYGHSPILAPPFCSPQPPGPGVSGLIQ